MRKAKSVKVHKHGAIISDADKTKYDSVIEMHDTIEVYRDAYASDLARRLEVDKRRLPKAYTFMALLNPMFGLEPSITGSGLMTKPQYDHARESLLRAMQDEFDSKSPYIIPDSGSENSLDGSIKDGFENDNYRIAEKELRDFELYKIQKYLPKFKYDHKISGINAKGRVVTLGYGPVREFGANLPDGRNYKQYLDEKGRFNNLKFFIDHKDKFPTLNLIVQREASRRVVEVGCERFFGLSGYISNPRRNTLGVRNYERIAMLAHMLNHIYIDPKWVAEEYMRRCKAKAWKTQATDESLKCFNLERIIEAEVFGKTTPKEVSMEEYLEGSTEL